MEIPSNKLLTRQDVTYAITLKPYTAGQTGGKTLCACRIYMFDNFEFPALRMFNIPVL